MAHQTSPTFDSEIRISYGGSRDDMIWAHDFEDLKFTESHFQQISMKILKIQKQNAPISTSEKFTESQVSSSFEASNPLKYEFAEYKIQEQPSNNEQESTSQPESFSNDFNLSNIFKTRASSSSEGCDKMFPHQVSEFAKSNLLFMKSGNNSIEFFCEKPRNEPQVPSLEKEKKKKIKWGKLIPSQQTEQEELKSNLDFSSPHKNQPQIVNQLQNVNSSDLNELVNQDSQDKKIDNQEKLSFQKIQNKNIKELSSQQKFDITNSKQRSKLLISVTDYGNKQFKSQQLITTFTLLQKIEGFQFIPDFNSLRKDQNSFYRAIMVKFLSKNFESTNTNQQQNFLFYQIFPVSFKKLTSRSNWFPSVNEEALKKHFIFRFNELIEGNIKIASSPRDVATLIIDMVSRDQYFDASCILISRNLSLQAFELICDNPSYSGFFSEGEKAFVQQEFLKGDQEPSEFAKIAIAQAFNMTISQENIFYDQRKQHINIQRNTYSPAQIDQSRQMISCNVINHEAQYTLAFSARYK